MRPLVIIQARMSSVRLPGKVLREMCGKPMLQYLVERVENCEEKDWVIATSIDSSDDRLEELCNEMRWPLFRGPLEDVALRCLQAADSNHSDVIVRLSGDSPFLDQAVINKAVAVFKEEECDLVTNVMPRTYPPGCSVEVFQTELLREKISSIPEDKREHVVGALYDDASLRVINFENHRDLSGYSLTVDNESDFLMAASIIEAMDRPHVDYSIDEVVELGRRIGKI